MYKELSNSREICSSEEPFLPPESALELPLGESHSKCEFPLFAASPLSLLTPKWHKLMQIRAVLNHGMLWVGRDLKPPSVPTPTPSTTPGCPNPSPSWPWTPPGIQGQDDVQGAVSCSNHWVVLALLMLVLLPFFSFPSLTCLNPLCFHWFIPDLMRSFPHLTSLCSSGWQKPVFFPKICLLLENPFFSSQKSSSCWKTPFISSSSCWTPPPPFFFFPKICLLLETRVGLDKILARPELA